VASGGGTGTFTFTANQTGCSPTTVSLANWITVSTNFSGAGGTVTFTAAANPLTSARSGTIQLGDQMFTVNQIASACAFSLNAYGKTFNNLGGSHSVSASPSDLGCAGPAVGASPEVILGPLQGPNNNIWTQPYTVPPFSSFNLWIRVLQISISGEIFTIKQSSWYW